VKRPDSHNLLPILALAAVLSLAPAGCAMTFDANSLGVPAGMASPAQQPAVGDTFDIRTHATFLLWGAIPSRVPSLAQTLEGQLAGGRAVQGLSIGVSRRWTDLLITVLTAGLVDPVSVRFHGVVVGASP
jgi:hypothetical protein